MGEGGFSSSVARALKPKDRGVIRRLDGEVSRNTWQQDRPLQEELTLKNGCRCSTFFHSIAFPPLPLSSFSPPSSLLITHYLLIFTLLRHRHHNHSEAPSLPRVSARITPPQWRRGPRSAARPRGAPPATDQSPRRTTQSQGRGHDKVRPRHATRPRAAQ